MRIVPVLAITTVLTLLLQGVEAQEKKTGPLPAATQLLDLPVNLREGLLPPKTNFPRVKLFDRKPLTFQTPQVSAGYSYLQDATGPDSSVFNQLNGAFNYDVAAGASLWQLPFDLSFRGNNSMHTYHAPDPSTLSKFNFNHKEYLENLRSKVLSKIQPDAVLATVMNRINTIRQQYESRLKQELEGMKKEFTAKYQSAIEIPAGVTDLSLTDLNSLKTKLIPGQDIRRFEESSARIQEQLKTGNSADSLVQDQLNVKRYELLQKMFARITEARERFENNKLVKELKQHLPFTPGNFKSYLSKPGNLEKVLDEHAELDFLQKLFVNMSRLDLGQNAVQSGEFGMQNLINAGVNTEFKNKKASVGFIYGRNNHINNWAQLGLVSAVTNEYTSVTGFKVGTGTGSPIEQSVSLNFFDFNSQPGTDYRDDPFQSAYYGIAPRREAVLSLHTGVTLAAKHKIGIDLSRSFGAFKNSMNADSSVSKMNAYNEIFGGEGSSNYAGMVDYEGELLQTDVRAFVKKVGMGYNNPGNYLLRRGETQIGLGISRKLLSRKLNLRYNIDYKKQQFDPAKTYSHRALTNKLQFGYRIKGNNRVGLSYQRSDFNSNMFAQAASKGANVRWQADGNYVFRINGRKIMNNVVLSHQRYDMPMLMDSSYKSNTVLVTYTSTVMVGRSPLSVTVLVNRSDNKDYLFNTSMLNMETNYSYPVGNNIQFSSGLGYYDNTGWNRQVGGRQQLSATLVKKLQLDVEFSYKKSIQTIREELANQFYAVTALRLNL